MALTDNFPINLQEGERFAFENLSPEEMWKKFSEYLEEVNFVHNFFHSLWFVLRESLQDPNNPPKMDRSFSYNLLLLGAVLVRLVSFVDDLLRIEKEEKKDDSKLTVVSG